MEQSNHSNRWLYIAFVFVLLIVSSYSYYRGGVDACYRGGGVLTQKDGCANISREILITDNGFVLKNVNTPVLPANLTNLSNFTI